MTKTEGGRRDRHILITGASSGIGAALAAQSAHVFSRVTLLGRSMDRLEAAAAVCRSRGAVAHIVACDVRDWTDLTRSLLEADAAHPIDTLVANAGVGGLRSMAGPVGEDIEAAREIMEVNALGVVASVSALAPAMIARGRGKVGIVSSLAAIAPVPLAPSYAASKAAVASYARNLRLLLKPSGVTVTLALPGFVDTPMSRDLPGAKPGLMSADNAASRIAAAIESGRAEIAFPLSLRLIAGAARLAPEPLVSVILRSWRNR